MEHELDFGLLGPLLVRRAGVVLDPGRRKQRLLLIRLLLADGRAVPPETLCEELWSPEPGRAPGRATASLHAHVSKVRAVLEPPHLRGRGAFGVLVTEPAGYALRVPPGSRDTVRFERAAARAHRLLEQGRTGHVVQEAEGALNMWRGAALADAAHHLFAAQEAARLAELRQSVREIRTTALLLQGRTVEAVEAARELTVEHPLRETGWALLLRALYIAGRHPEALQRYADLRRLLADELGLDPGPQLRALHDGILRHDLPPLPQPGTTGTAGTTAGPGAGTGDGGGAPGPAGSGAPKEGESTTPVGGTPPARATGAPDAAAAPSGESGAPTASGDGIEQLPSACPAQLPNDLPVFAGRTTESAWLSAASGAPGRPGSAGAPVVVIGGAPGVGKTTFAVHHAHQIASSFPDGQLFVNLCGFHPHAPAVEPGDALHGFLTALGVPAPRIPEDTPGRSTLFRSLLAGRRVLLVLDNARDEQQVRPLLPAGTGCLTLVTSRNQLVGLIATDGAKPLTLPLPSPAEAHETLARRLGAERLAAEPTAADDIIGLCGRLPLALAVVAARAELDPAFPLHAIADDLRHASGGLEAFTGSDTTTDVRAVFSWSYHSLEEPAARLFRLLALHPGPDITTPAAAGLTALPLAQTRRLLAELTRSCLLEQPLPGRFALHDLLRDYATELTHTHDTTEERHHATLRVLDHYMFTAHAANRLLKHYILPEIDLGAPSTGVAPEDLTTVEQADRWLTAEHRVLSGLLHTAVGQGLDRRITGLAWALKEHLNRREFWPEAINALTPALEVARRRADRLEEGRCHHSLGSIHGHLGHQEQALDHLQRATALFEEIDAVGEQARTHYSTACALYRFGRIQEALVPAERGLVLARTSGDDVWTAESLNGLSWLHSSLGRPEVGLVHCEEALALFQALNAPWREAICWDSLGYTLHLLGRYEEAEAAYKGALKVFEEVGDHRNLVGSLMRLGDTRLAMGASEAARADWVRALAHAEQQALPRSVQQVRDRLAALDAEADGTPVAPEEDTAGGN
ncbi:BTAD domain-containing putative transcriptional regulator [Streptomyces sp. ALI-76-A]|uniref:AfsR/SARP family transcriptional regulator n=1 Tax=Streptomyces sp. ALI-76-A TaxID=3025736 RepID=UPI00256F294F|nr:BTAD domain-containing putative transcriptional regulator [Streptomyces sp. ALI-76-A]MDL5198850.1 BTAD domain-containing putative transcriptional regulator [Streptomyces sp. ALI-76-A]